MHESLNWGGNCFICWYSLEKKTVLFDSTDSFDEKKVLYNFEDEFCVSHDGDEKFEQKKSQLKN